MRSGSDLAFNARGRSVPGERPIIMTQGIAASLSLLATVETNFSTCIGAAS